MRKRSAEQELRIKLYYDESVYRLTKQQYNLIHETVLPSAVTYWGQALRVRKTENRIRLSRYAEPAGLFEKGRLTPVFKANTTVVDAETICGKPFGGE